MTGPAQASTRPPATDDAHQVRPVRCRRPPLRSRPGRPSSCWCNEPGPYGVTATLGKGLPGPGVVWADLMTIHGGTCSPAMVSMVGITLTATTYRLTHDPACGGSPSLEIGRAHV